LLGRLLSLGYHAGGMVWLEMRSPSHAATMAAQGRPVARAWALWAACILVVAVGCGSGLAGQTYRHGDIAFDVGPIPGSWHQVDADDAALTFRDDAARATIAVNARCHEEGDDVPLKALTKHLFLEFTNRNSISERTVPLDGREALRTELLADLDGVPMHFTVYVLKKDWCVYDFMHIADLDSPASSRANFDRFVAGFRTRG
jgi:hypothetical protein